MGEIKPIETFFKGDRFRSRLEARWAVFFDALGIEYNYEQQGYRMSNGDCYLPDFYLPNSNYYVEVKGFNDHLFEDISRINQFVLEAKTAVLILSNVPYDPNSKGLFWFPLLFYSARCGGIVDGCRVFFGKDEDHGYIQSDFYVGCHSRVYLNTDVKPKYGDVNKKFFNDIQPIFGSQLDEEENKEEGCYLIKDCFEDVLLPVEAALQKARQARFEHGEKGGV